MATNKDLLDRLERIEKKLPNGELEEIHKACKEIKKLLLDPEEGLVVRVNQNTYWRRQLDVDEFKAILRWKQNVTHALWVSYAVLVGIILKMVFY